MQRRHLTLYCCCLIATALPFCLSPAYAAPNHLPTAQSLFAAFKAASGGSNWDSVSTIITYAASAKRDGIRGGFIDYQDVKTGSYAWHDCHSIDSTSGGCDSSGAWAVDHCNIVRNSDSPENCWDAESVRYWTSLAYWYPSRHGAEMGDVKIVRQGSAWYYCADVAVESGYTVDFWFDPVTHLLYRIDEFTPTGDEVTTYSDYRPVNGVLLPYVQVTNGEITYTAVSILINQPLSPSIFAKPGPSLPDYTIKPDTDGSTTVPFIYKAGHIFFPIKINGKGPFDAILDTGGRLMTNPQFASKNKITVYGGITANGIGPGVVPAGLAQISDAEIGGITINNLEDLVAPFPIDAVIIGPELFQRFAVKIDFDRSTLTLTPLTSFHYTGNGTVVPFHFYGDTPEVDSKLDGIDGEFTVDTGQDQSIALFGSFVQSQSIAKKYGAAGVPMIMGGIGGLEYMTASRCLIFTLGNAAVIGPIISFANVTTGIFGDQFLAGNIGCPLLHRFNVTFDYADQQIILEPNSHNAEADPWNGLGTIGMEYANGFKVFEVVSRSPADLAGIKKGDMITQLNGKAVTASDLEWFKTQEQLPNGTVVHLTVKHRNHQRSLSIALKEPF